MDTSTPAQTPRRINLDGIEYVPIAEFEAKEEEAGKWRRSLATAHMLLTFGDPRCALAVISRDTGDGIEQARAVREIVAWASQQRQQEPTS